MRKLVVGTFLTMDGVMQAPGGPDEDREGGFLHGGWLVPFFDETLLAIMTEWTKRAGAFLLGRKTYEIFAASWPNATDPADEIAVALNTRPKYVASRTLRELRWNNSTLLEGDVADEVARLKRQEGGEIQVHGSGGLLQTLLRHDLVDVLRLWQFPVVVGAGKRLFGEGAIPRSFRLVETQRTGTGAVLHVYERVGGLRYGEVEVGRETVVDAGTDREAATFRTRRLLAHPPDRVYDAFARAELLARWWGPSGFTNRFEGFEFEPGGKWKYVMHGPNGGDYRNESVFRRLEPGSAVVIHHLSKPRYVLTISLTPHESGTVVDWVQAFEEADVAERIRHIVVPANEQNLDRLAAALAGAPIP